MSPHPVSEKSTAATPAMTTNIRSPSYLRPCLAKSLNPAFVAGWLPLINSPCALTLLECIERHH
jgi:hypothetical protein